MRTSVMTDYVEAGLARCLVSAVKSVNKVTTSGSNGSWVQGSTTTDKFWLLSMSEVLGTSSDGNTLIGTYFYEEGSQYAWFTKNGVNGKSGTGTKNVAIGTNCFTRAGNSSGTKPEGSTSDGMWLRSPVITNATGFGRVYENGYPSYNVGSWSLGVVPCFSLGPKEVDSEV